MNDTTACRHCQGLVAGQANQCPKCRRWLRRHSYRTTQFLGGTSSVPANSGARRELARH